MTMPIAVNAKQLSEIIIRFLGDVSNDRIIVTGESGSVTLLHSSASLAVDAPWIIINPKTKEYCFSSLLSIDLLKGIDAIYVNAEVGFYNAFDVTRKQVPLLDITTDHVKTLLRHFVSLPC